MSCPSRRWRSRTCKEIRKERNPPPLTQLRSSLPQHRAAAACEPRPALHPTPSHGGWAGRWGRLRPAGSIPAARCADCCWLPPHPHLGPPSLPLPGVTFQTHHPASSAGLRLLLEEPTTSMRPTRTYVSVVFYVWIPAAPRAACDLEQVTPLLRASIFCTEKRE